MALELPKIPLFEGLSDDERAFFLSHAKELFLKTGDVIMHEGDPPDNLYIILEGSVDVMRRAGKEGMQRIIHLLKNDTIGKIALADNAPRSATVMASMPTILLSIPFQIIRQNPEIEKKVIGNVATDLATRLRYTNDVTIASMEKTLQEEKKRTSLALFTEIVLTNLAVYTLGLSLIKAAQNLFLNTAVVSTILIYLVGLSLLLYAKKAGLPKEAFGITKKRWKFSVIHSLMWTIPAMGVILIIKWFFVHFVPGFGGGIIEPRESFTWGGVFHSRSYIVAMTTYILSCPVQELMVRGCLQGSLYKLSSPGSHFSPILISNLIFAAFHTQISIWFAISVFFMGLFWGWLYKKERNIIGVSLSHIILGTWAGFVVGIQELLVVQ